MIPRIHEGINRLGFFAQNDNSAITCILIS